MKSGSMIKNVNIYLFCATYINGYYLLKRFTDFAGITKCKTFFIVSSYTEYAD